MEQLEQQVTSLEVSQRIEELGFKQFESYFQWVIDELPKKGRSYVSKTGDEIEPGNDRVDAYTVAELEIYLPTNVVCQNTSFGEVLVKLLDEESETIYFTREENGADARAKMLCYLVENKLITI